MAIIDTFGDANRLAGSPGFAPVPGLRPLQICGEHFKRTAARGAPEKIAYRMQAIGDTSGVAAVEFAFLLPVLLLVMVGTFTFGIAFNNYIILTNAAQAGTFQLAVSRGASTTPWNDTRTAVFNAAPGLTQANLTITLTVNGTACTSNSTCQTALAAATGQSAAVTVAYPCSLTVMQINYAPSCTLTAKSTGRIQ